MPRYRRRRSFKRRVARVVKSLSETKYYDEGYENVQLYHDVGQVGGPTTFQIPLVFDPWQRIAVGNTRSTRIGDKIMPIGIKFRLWIANKADRPNVTYRLIVINIPMDIAGTLTTSSNVDLFFAMNSGTLNQTLIAMIDKNRFTNRVYMDKIIRLERGQVGTAAGVNKEIHTSRSYYFKFGGTMIFDHGGVTHNRPNFAIYLIPYDSYGTLQTDNIASCAYLTRLYWKDI